MWKTFPIIKGFVNYLWTRIFWPQLCSFWCYWQSEKFSNYQNLCQPSYILAPGVLFNVIDNLNSFQILSTKFSLFFPGSPSPHILTNIIGSREMQVVGNLKLKWPFMNTSPKRFKRILSFSLSLCIFPLISQLTCEQRDGNITHQIVSQANSSTFAIF